MRFYKFLILMFIGLSLSAVSCKKEANPGADDGKEKVEQFVVLNKSSATLVVGEELTLTPKFGMLATPQLVYEWETDNPDVVSISSNDDYSAKITAIAEGTATVTISSTTGSLAVSCTITVEGEEEEPVDDGVVRILAIGNSFSKDAVDDYFYELATENGTHVVVGNMTIGSASLDLHWQNASGDKADYDYRKVSENGTVSNASNRKLSTVLTEEPWDYISLQQVSSNSGQYNTFETPLPLLYDYVKSKATNPSVKIILHQTWAYAQNSTHAGFANYGSDQMTMYHAIVDAVGRAGNLINADLIIPVGTAIQNGRTSVIGDNFNRDGYHLDMNIGRYTAACTWFEAIFGINVVGHSFKPSGLSDYDAEIAQHAAHFAIQNPNEVTEMVDYQYVGGPDILQDPILIGFGYTTATPGWDGFIGREGSVTGSTIANLRDSKDNLTGISLVVTEGFHGNNVSGEKGTTTDLNIPDNISSYSYFGNSTSAFQGKLVEKSVITLSGLNKDGRYNLCFFGSRKDVAEGDNRETKYTAKGKNEVTAYINTSNNTSEIACTNNIQPDDAGEVTITITAGENNNSANGFYYLSVLRISAAE
ncbi:DUF4886 domain-containing protein [Sphingobacterium sp. SGG-5]|uniref:DUF4886 domain-containing protein n=1 Tax=Sphingobacterium sp. SGG-5 TaxID=2710881 RepID=UPI0013ECF0D0|nr:DUF4886 domain-containing protein [Sphingobacterium sp. SGG-5]NGM61208.1 DUF4886 domain-containing protein [Sphingobacterium sp. SGG-5]